MTFEEFALEAKARGKTKEETLSAVNKYRETYGNFDDEIEQAEPKASFVTRAGGIVPEPPTFKERLPIVGTYKYPEFAIATPTQLRETLNGADIGVANLSGTPDEHLASLGNAKFFAEQYWLDRDTAIKQELLIGRALYGNDSLSSYQINSLINADIKAGTFHQRAKRAKWTQHGVSPEVADELDGIYHSSVMDDISFYVTTPAAGIGKAVAGLVVGLGDTFGIDTPMTESFLSELEREQAWWLDDALIEGDMGHYMVGSILKAGSDIGGNLWMMGRILKTVNAATGGSLTIGTKEKTIRTMLQSTAGRVSLFGALSYLKTPGTPEEKFKSSLLTMAYMSTPAISSMAPNNFATFLVDFGMNSGITAFYNPKTGEFGTGGQYAQAKQDAKELAEQIGRPEDEDRIFLAMSIPIIGSDIAFSAMTKSIRQSKNTPLLQKYIESARVIQSKNKVSLSEFESALRDKYGEGWEQSMSESDRIRYNGLRVVNDAMESGGISEKALETPAMDTVSRVKIENGKVTYRDSDGVMRDVESRPASEIAKPTEAPTQEAPKLTEQPVRALTGEGEALLDKTFKEIERQAKKAQSATFGEAAKEIKDYRKLVAGLPQDRRATLLAKLQAVIDAKTPETKEKRRAILIEEVAKLADQKERASYINTINKGVSGEYAYEQKRAIQVLKDGLITDASEKATREMNATREYIAENPDAKIPDALRNKLKKADVNNLTTEELRVVADEITRLRKERATKAKLLRKNQDAEYVNDAKAIQSTMKQPRKPLLGKELKEDIVGKKNRKPSIKFSAERPDRAMDRLDGNKGTFDGKAHKIFIDNKRSAEAARDDAADARIEPFEKLLRSLEVPVKSLNRRVKLFDDSKPMSIQSLMGVYAGSKNRLNRSAILHAHFGGNEEKMQIAIDYIANNPKWKTIADYILYDGANNTPRFFDAVGKLTGKVLVPEDFYVPMNRIDVERPTDMVEIQSQLMNRVRILKEAPNDSMTIARKYLKDAAQTKIDLDLVSNWMRNVNGQEHLIHLAPVVKHMRGISESKGFMDSVREAYGEGMVEQINGLIDRTANPMSIRATGNWNKLSRRARKNLSSAYLAGNVKTMLKQFPSFLLYAGEVGLFKLTDSLGQVLSSFEEVDGKIKNTILDFVAEKDPTIKHSHLQRELDELRQSDPGKYNQIMDKVGEAGFAGIIAVDRIARSAGWYAVYNKAIESGKSEDEAIRLARNATLRTQPSSAASELPPMYASNEGMNWLLMFSNQLNLLWNMQTKDVPRRLISGIKDKDMERIGMAIGEQVGIVLSALLIGAINEGGLDNGEDAVQAIMQEGFASVPLVGSSLSGAVDGWKPSFQIVDTAYEAGKIIVTLSNGEKVTQEEYIDFIINDVAPFGGVPVVGGKRIIKAVEEGDPTEILGIKKKKRKGRL